MERKAGGDGFLPGQTGNSDWKGPYRKKCAHPITPLIRNQEPTDFLIQTQPSLDLYLKKTPTKASRSALDEG